MLVNIDKNSNKIKPVLAHLMEQLMVVVVDVVVGTLVVGSVVDFEVVVVTDGLTSYVLTCLPLFSLAKDLLP